jgi:hypothetical protein
MAPGVRLAPRGEDPLFPLHNSMYRYIELSVCICTQHMYVCKQISVSNLPLGIENVLALNPGKVYIMYIHKRHLTSGHPSLPLAKSSPPGSTSCSKTDPWCPTDKLCIAEVQKQPLVAGGGDNQ